MSDSQGKIDAFMKRLYAAADVALTDAGAVLADTIVKSLGRDHGGIRSQPEQPPNSQRGGLSRSIGYSQAKGLRSIVGSGIFYAKVLEYGKVIHAKKKAMVFPVSPIGEKFMTRASNAHAALLAFQYTYGKNVVRIKTATGVLIGHKVGGKNKRYEIDFMLTAKVQIKPRPFMRPSLAKAKASKSMSNAFAETMRREMGVK